MKPLNTVCLGNGVAITSYIDQDTVLVEVSVHTRLKDASNLYPTLDSALTDRQGEKTVFEQLSELWGAKTNAEVAVDVKEAMDERGHKGWQLLCSTCKMPQHTKLKKVCSNAFHTAKVGR